MDPDHVSPRVSFCTILEILPAGDRMDKIAAGLSLRASFTKVPCYQNFLQIRSYIRFLHDQASTQECSPGSSPQALSVHFWGRADVSKPGSVRLHQFNPVLLTALKQL